MASFGVLGFLDTLLAGIQFQGVPVPVLRWDETDQPSEDVWIAVEEDYSTEETVSIGTPSSRCLREEGSITLHVFSDIDTPLPDVRSFVESVRDSLRYQNLNGIRFLNVDPPVPLALVNGRLNELEVTLHYERDYSKP